MAPEENYKHLDVYKEAQAFEQHKKNIASMTVDKIGMQGDKISSLLKTRHQHAVPSDNKDATEAWGTIKKAYNNISGGGVDMFAPEGEIVSPMIPSDNLEKAAALEAKWQARPDNLPRLFNPFILGTGRQAASPCLAQDDGSLGFFIHSESLGTSMYSAAKKLDVFNNKHADVIASSIIEHKNAADIFDKYAKMKGKFGNTTMAKIRKAQLFYAKDAKDLAENLEKWALSLSDTDKAVCFSQTFVVGGLHAKKDDHSYPVHVIYSKGRLHAFSFDGSRFINKALYFLLGRTFATVSFNKVKFQFTNYGCREYAIRIGENLKADKAYQQQLLGAAEARFVDKEYIKNLKDFSELVYKLRGGDRLDAASCVRIMYNNIDFYGSYFTGLIGNHKLMPEHINRIERDSPEQMSIVKHKLEKRRARGELKLHNFITKRRKSVDKKKSIDSVIEEIKKNKNIVACGYRRRLHDTIKKSIKDAILPSCLKM